MANHRKFPRPPEALRDVLAECRGEGLSFDEAWRVALGTRRCRGRVRFPDDTVQRRGWRDALAATREEWRAAYLGRETALSRALALVAAEDDTAQPAVLAGERAPRLGHVTPPVGIGISLRTRERAAA